MRKTRRNEDGFLFSLWKITAKANTEPPDYPGGFLYTKNGGHQAATITNHELVGIVHTLSCRGLLIHEYRI